MFWDLYFLLYRLHLKKTQTKPLRLFQIKNSDGGHSKMAHRI